MFVYIFRCEMRSLHKILIAAIIVSSSVDMKCDCSSTLPQQPPMNSLETIIYKYESSKSRILCMNNLVIFFSPYFNGSIIPCKDPQATRTQSNSSQFIVPQSSLITKSATKILNAASEWYFYYDFYFYFSSTTTNFGQNAQVEHSLRLHGIKAKILSKLKLDSKPILQLRAPRDVDFSKFKLVKIRRYFFVHNNYLKRSYSTTKFRLLETVIKSTRTSYTEKETSSIFPHAVRNKMLNVYELHNGISDTQEGECQIWEEVLSKYQKSTFSTLNKITPFAVRWHWRQTCLKFYCSLPNPNLYHFMNQCILIHIPNIFVFVPGTLNAKKFQVTALFNKNNSNTNQVGFCCF